MENSKYQFQEGMQEISGFGGGYEDACRKMVVAGLEWWDAHPDADVSYKEYKNIYGLTTGESDDCKLMEKAMLESVPDCSGAMMQASKGHIMFIHKNGWDKYVEEMSKPEVAD
jgi:hypothetical protein